MSASASERAGSSRVARQGLILELIQAHEIGSQNELADMLAEHGIRVSQGTLSKDLLDIGAVRVRSSAGVLVYAPPGLDVASDRTLREQRLARICAEVLVSAIGLSVWKDAVVFLLLIIVLIVKPTGILGRTINEKV